MLPSALPESTVPYKVDALGYGHICSRPVQLSLNRQLARDASHDARRDFSRTRYSVFLLDMLARSYW